MFYYEIQWFYQNFKSENLCFLNLYSIHASENTRPVTRDRAKSSKMKNETPLVL